MSGQGKAGERNGSIKEVERGQKKKSKTKCEYILEFSEMNTGWFGPHKPDLQP